MIYSILKRILFIVIGLSFCITSNAQWWNPLAPKDYNECIIQNLKKGMGEEAVIALKDACAHKYPEETQEETQSVRNKREKRYEKCGIDIDKHMTHHFIGIGTRQPNHVNKVLEDIKNFIYDEQSNSVRFQNANSFGISGIYIGFTKSKRCPSDMKDFSYSTYCAYSTDRGVYSGSFGSLRCGELPREVKTMGYCKLGFSPIYNQFDDSYIEFLESHGYCN